MALGSRHVKLDSPTARMKLPARHAPYWTLISPGCSLGYRRSSGSKCGTWLAKYSPPDAKRVQSKLAVTDDRISADGVLCLDFLQARKKALDWFPIAAQISTGQISRRQGYSVADACRDYLNLLEGRSKSFLVTRYIIGANIEPLLGDRLVEKLTRSQIEHWHKELARTPRRKPRNRLDPESEEARRRRRDTANRYLIVLKAALNHCLTEGKVGCTGMSWKLVAPFKGVGNVRTRFLTDAEARLLVAACPPEFSLIVQAALFSGARYSEIASLRVQDFDPISGTLLIAQSKSGKPRRVYLDTEAAESFSAQCAGRQSEALIFMRDGKPWGKDSAQGLMEVTTRSAEISTATFHELRHTAASRWARLGLSLQEIAAQLGHADVRMTQRYAHLCQVSLAVKVRSLPTMGISQFGRSHSAHVTSTVQ
jgi:integrase